MTTEREKMLAGELYDPDDAELVRLRRRCRELSRELGAMPPSDEAGRRGVLTALFGTGGDTVRVEPPFMCDYGVNIELGERVFFNFDCVVLDAAEVRIGDFTMFGPAAQIYTSVHPFDPALRRARESARPVEIGADVWIGGGAIILPGVRIGAGTVIGAGSVVTHDVPADVVAVGNPCRVIRRRGG